MWNACNASALTVIYKDYIEWFPRMYKTIVTTHHLNVDLCPIVSLLLYCRLFYSLNAQWFFATKFKILTILLWELVTPNSIFYD